MERHDEAAYRLRAQVLKALAQPRRLRILDLLRDGERSVGELARALEAPQANVSQHLAALRAQELVATRRQGTSVYYCLAHPEIAVACDLFHDVLLRRLEESRALAEQVRRTRARRAARPAAPIGGIP
mgnify:CR=1 FL=1